MARPLPLQLAPWWIPSDVAALRAQDVDWETQTIAYQRRKTGTPVILRFGEDLTALLRTRPSAGPLFPRIAELHEKHRAKLFNRRRRLAGVNGVSLHSYRYAWAERAIACGYPERFAQAALDVGLIALVDGLRHCTKTVDINRTVNFLRRVREYCKDYPAKEQDSSMKSMVDEVLSMDLDSTEKKR